MGIDYKNQSMKSDFSQMHLSRYVFDFVRGIFCMVLIVNEFEQTGFIGLIGCLIINVPINSAHNLCSQSNVYNLLTCTLLLCNSPK